jgi:hypothetical protein
MEPRLGLDDQAVPILLSELTSSPGDLVNQRNDLHGLRI